MSFAVFQPPPALAQLSGHLVLARAVYSPRFREVAVQSSRNVLHAFRVDGPDQVDDEFVGWLGEAYAVGEQRHVE
jgi:hypothetical protein